MTWVQGQRNFAADTQQAQHIIVALIHMIYTTYSTTIQWSTFICIVHSLYYRGAKFSYCIATSSISPSIMKAKQWVHQSCVPTWTEALLSITSEPLYKRYSECTIQIKVDHCIVILYVVYIIWIRATMTCWACCLWAAKFLWPWTLVIYLSNTLSICGLYITYSCTYVRDCICMYVLPECHQNLAWH